MTNELHDISPRHHTLEVLSSFVRGELAAKDCYAHVIEEASEKTMSPGLIAALSELQESHEDRARILAETVRSLGGEPPKSPGAWGTLVRAATWVVSPFGTKAEIGLLERGERLGLDRYQLNALRAEDGVLPILYSQVLPEQRATLLKIRALKESGMNPN